MTRVDHDAQAILQQARNGAVWAGCLLSEAVAAHQIAFAQFRESGAAEDRRVGEFVLRAILFCRIRDLDDSLSRHSYLSGLPEEAWPAIHDATSAEVRADYLATFKARIDRSAA